MTKSTLSKTKVSKAKKVTKKKPSKKSNTSGTYTVPSGVHHVTIGTYGSGGWASNYPDSKEIKKLDKKWQEDGEKCLLYLAALIYLVALILVASAVAALVIGLIQGMMT
jgi:hypothetical protein